MPGGRQPYLHLQFLLVIFAGWINRHQQAVIECLQAETQSLREQLGNKRIHWTDVLRRRLTEKAKAIGRSALAAFGTVVTPDTLLRWYRNLVAATYDGSKKRGPGRPRRKPDIAKLVVRRPEKTRPGGTPESGGGPRYWCHGSIATDADGTFFPTMTCGSTVQRDSCGIRCTEVLTDLHRHLTPPSCRRQSWS